MFKFVGGHIEVGRELKASTLTVWALITDTYQWKDWGPSVVAVDCPERCIRKGLRGRIRTPLGLWVPFAISEVDPPRFWSWRVFGIPATGHRLDPLGPGICRLTFEVPIFGGPYAAICAVALSRIAGIAEKGPSGGTFSEPRTG